MSMIFLLCLLAFCNAQEIYLFNGKAADSCVNSDVLPGIANRDCITTEVPEPSNTVLLPAVTSVAPVITAGSTLTITGQSLEQLPNFGTAAFVVGLSLAGGRCAAGFDPALATAVVACSTATATCSSIQFSLPASWITSAMELETFPRRLCLAGAAGPYYTGFKIGTVWDCNDAVAATSCANLPRNTAASARNQAIRSARTVCCRHTRMGAANVAAANAQFAVGQCVNPNVTACCQGAIVEPARMRCCNADYETVQWLDSPCPCRTNNPICPGTQQCCTATKYPELINSDAIWPQQPGQCFDPATQLCCNTGFAYNPGVQQCCSINGVQSANVPCPCGQDSDCQGGQTTSKDAFGVENGMFCCAQDQPSGTETPTCSAYTNFPTGTAPYQVQRCPGVCIDNRFQICCNGLVCRKEYDKCCNSSCCNKRVGTCMEAQRAQAPGYKRNPLEIGIRYEVCSTIEQMDPLRAYWIFVLPTFLLASTFLGVAVVVAFINHSTRRSYSFIERTMIVLAVLTTIFALPAYFAPIYKYGVWVCFTCIFTMVAAAARVRWLNAAAVVLNFVLLMYLFDPFNGNRYFNFASLRVQNGDADPESGGLLAATGKSWRSLNSVNTARYCTQWYDYFSIDFQMVDERWYNTDRVTFGYCSRGWVTALLIFEGLVLLLTLVQFVLAFIALILRFAEERSLDPIELQVHGAQEVPLMMYGY